MPHPALRGLATTVLTFLGSLLLASTLSQPNEHPVFASTKSDRAAGMELFHEKGCEHCHGVDGVGGDKGPNLSGVGRKLHPMDIENQILKGGDAMPAFADVLAPDEVKLLVEYLSAKKKIVKVKQSAAPSTKPVSKPNTGGSDDQ